MSGPAYWWKHLGFWLASYGWFKRAIGPALLTPLDRVAIARTGRSITSPSASPRALPMLNLTAVGAKTGELRTVPLAYFERDGLFIVVGSNWGRAAHPGWSANLLAHPEATVRTTGWQGRVVAERLDDEAIAAIWTDLAAHLPNWDDYRRETEGRHLRVFSLRPLE